MQAEVVGMGAWSSYTAPWGAAQAARRLAAQNWQHNSDAGACSKVVRWA